MEIKKVTGGHILKLDFKLIKIYKNYNLYEVYKDKKLLYRECLTYSQIKDIIHNGKIILEEVFE